MIDAVSKASDVHQFRSMFANAAGVVQGLVGNSAEIQKSVARLGAQLEKNTDSLETQLSILNESIETTVCLEADEANIDTIIERVGCCAHHLSPPDQ
jgi:hypothetical protein